MASKAASSTGPQLPANQPKQKVALPLHVQKLQRALDLGTFINQVEQVYNNSLKLVEISRKDTDGLQTVSHSKNEGYHSKDFNFSSVTEERQWVKDVLLSPSEGSDSELSETEQLQILLELQSKRRKKWKKRLRKGHKLLRYKYFSSGMLFCSKDPYPEHIRRLEDRLRKPVKKGKDAKTPQEREAYREKLWSFITKKEIPKMAKQFSMARHTAVINCKKVALLCQREVKKAAAKSQRASKEVSNVQPRARRLMKEALIYWRKYEKVEREQRKKAEKEAMEQRKRDDEMREAKRQQRKLNFLITQTELYAHFIGKKLTGEADQSEKILQKLEDKPLTREVRPGVTVNLEGAEEYDSEAAKAQALANVQSALEKQQNKKNIYSELAKPGKSAEELQESFDNTFSLATPMLQSDQELPQPQMFSGTLKAYQLKGMNWLANLYDQGINGILADEMGLGKTVQSVAFMAHLAEHQGIWGPFLIVSPASTLHNWQQECTRFVPKFKTLPYWGSPHERKIIRKYWNQKFLYNEHAPFHVLITSYQLVVQDVKYFQRVKWQYMILDEAQAIKSSNSIRWKVLLSFNCRNRLLLTGTPIQNTMQELWALLHFIMPSMFDSHEEFNEWFSRDIESHAERKSVMDEHQLSRLHLILKPFMLRRIKKDVEHEMAEKIEVHLSCELSTRQKKLYLGVKQRISIDDLLQSSLAPPTSNRDSTTSHLLNLVMQFRKVCNHPDLFERRNVVSPAIVDCPTYSIPRLIYHTSLFPPSYRLTQLGIHAADHIHQSATPASGHANSLWSSFKLSGWSVQEMSVFMLGGLADRLVLLSQFISSIHSIYHKRIWDKCCLNGKSQLLLWPSFKLSSFSRASSSVLGNLVFVSHLDAGYAHLCHRTYPLRTSFQTSSELSKISSTVSGTLDGGREEMDTTATEHQRRTPENWVASESETEAPSLREVVYWSKLPSFLFAYSPRVDLPWQPAYCSSRSAENHRLMWVLNGGPPLLKDILLRGPGKSSKKESSQVTFHPVQDIFGGQSLAGLTSLCPPNGWSHIQIPDKDSMIFDSGKMAVLDKLLVNLKREQHRVLIYSQMTRMIDLLEEFMGYRRYRYIRLDGSSRISDRRDMVADFQTNSEIFVFLLSTRAGGLGINLTAADTVIFYDSDWNPTVDQQAMDRAHRLGQTKQVTVYRLIVRGTIEEKILQRAREKSEIQKMVISGGDFRPDALKAKEMVSLLLDDDEMETRFLAKQAEKKAILERIEQGKKAAKSKKRPRALNGKDPVEPSSKRAKARGNGQHQLEVTASNTPSPSPLTLSTSRPTSVLSVASGALDIPNGDDFSDIHGSTDGSEVNSEVSGPGTTPVRKAVGKSKLGLHGITASVAGGDSSVGGALLQVPSLSPSPSANGGRRVKQTSAPLGGRGRMQKTVGKKGVGKGSSKGGGAGSAAASAGAKAGAKAATDAAYAAYGIPISPSPVNSPAPSVSTLPAAYNPSSSSTHSSPRVSPVPMAFVATSLVSTTSASNRSPSSKQDHLH